jgi:hypothetical protein
LNSKLQDGKKIDKWINKSRMAVNLEPSSQHAKSALLALRLKTGLVSPQFHVHKYSNTLKTLRTLHENQLHKSHWQRKYGFLEGPTGTTYMWKPEEKGVIPPTEDCEETPRNEEQEILIEDPPDQLEASSRRQSAS